MNPVDFSSSMLATLGALGRGTVGSNRAQQPEQPLELYEMEGCPFCRLVREALTELDLDVIVYPCPKNGKRFRPLVATMGGDRKSAGQGKGEGRGGGRISKRRRD